MELEVLEDIIREEIVANRRELNSQLDTSCSEITTIPEDPNSFYIHLADYFDVMAGEYSALLRWPCVQDIVVGHIHSHDVQIRNCAH